MLNNTSYPGMWGEGERFVERGTKYGLQHGDLWIYETNVACQNVKFKFKNYVLTLMLLGHKNIRSPQMNFEFFPGTLFIPERQTEMSISIPNATFTNPTKCLVLHLDPAFMRSFAREIAAETAPAWYPDEYPREMDYFLSNDARTVECFARLYELRKEVKSEYDQLIVTNAMKELVLRVFQTPGGQLLMDNIQEGSPDKALEKVMLHITSNLGKKLSIEELARHAGISKTGLFHKFKTHTGLTPVQYITQERINYAKLLLGQGRYLKDIAFDCGFNSYEHFCKTFKKLEGVSPREQRSRILSASA